MVGEAVLKMSSLRWGGVLRFIFGMTCGVGRGSYFLRRLSHCCIALQGTRMRLWPNICARKMGLLIGMCSLLDRYKIGSWKAWNLFFLFFTLLTLVRMRKINWCGYGLPTWSGFFEVKSSYKTLTGRGSHSFPWKSI